MTERPDPSPELKKLLKEYRRARTQFRDAYPLTDRSQKRWMSMALAAVKLVDKLDEELTREAS